jgi:hypothetical protein
MPVKYELVVPNGTYQKDGKNKNSWLKIGRIMTKNNGGFVMKIDCTPTSVIDLDGSQKAWDGWVHMMEPRPREQDLPQDTKQQSNDFDDDIPF